MSDVRVGAVLEHLRRPHTQADDPDTHTLLDLGVSLMLDPPCEVTTDLTQRVPQLRWPTREELVRAYNKGTGLRRSKAIVEDRWVRMADFHRDLIAWVIQRVERTTHAQMRDVADATPLKASGAVDSHRLSAETLERLLAEPAFPLWAMFMSLAATDEAVNRMINQARTADMRRWAALAGDHFEAAGREPLPGLDCLDIAEVVTAMSYGIALRYLTDPSRFGHQPGRASALFAQANLAVVDALLTPAEHEEASGGDVVAALARTTSVV